MAALFLNRYESLGFLGKGSMGQVYLARPMDRPNERVVVKVMKPAIADDPRSRDFFLREIHLSSALNHPYTVRLLDGSLNDPHGPCLVLEYIPGVTLDQFLKKQRRFSIERTGVHLGYLCHALQAAHNLGIVHRDLKPANLMIMDVNTENESLRVMDFGLAQMVAKPMISAERLAGAQVIAAQGTPLYICPEQLRGDELDGRADLYSVGIILYELLVGKRPFDYEDVQKLLKAHVKETPPKFAHFGVTSISPAIEAIVQRCLCKFPVERHANAIELLEDYGRAIGYDLLEMTRPENWTPPAPVEKAPAAKKVISHEPNSLVDEVEAWMPERIAVVKLGGFLEDYGGKVILTEPGLLRVRIGDEPTESFLVSLFRRTKPVADPIQIDFHMEKPKANENLLVITVVFRSPPGQNPRDPNQWRLRCERLNRELRAYLMAQR